MVNLQDAQASDDALIGRIAHGDGSALASLLQRHGAAFMSIARAVAASPADVDDVVQETALAVLRSASTYVPGRSAQAWLYAIARNAARRTHRHTNAQVQAPFKESGLAADWGAPQVPLEHDSETQTLAFAVAALPSAEREVLVLRDIEGFSGEAAAHAAGISVAAMKSRLHRARHALMSALERAEQPGGVQSEEHAGVTCGDVLPRIVDYLAGEVDEEERGWIEAHLRECESCERLAGRYAGLVAQARERLGLPHRIDPATFARVLQALSC